MEKISLNTHDYDGMLEIPQNIRTQLKDISLYPKSKKLQCFLYLKDMLRKNLNNVGCDSLKYLNMIEHDIGTSNNIDNTNNLIAEDLIILLYEISNDKDADIFKMISFALADIKNGSCSQGRTTRLYQIVEAYF